MTQPAPYTTHGLYGDVMGDLRGWLRLHPYLSSLSGRVFFRIPERPTVPLLRIHRSGGGNQPGEAPIEDVQVGIDVWGGTYAEIVTLTNDIKSALHLMPSGTHLGTSTVCLNADVIGEVDSPDPDTGSPRKIITALLTVRSVTDRE